MTIAVDSNALTDLVSVKRHIGITDTADDQLLTVLINQVSARIEKLTNTKFKARDLRLWLNPSASGQLIVPQSPLVYVNRVSNGSKDAISVDYSGAEIRATAQVYRDETGQSGGMRLVSYDGDGARTTNELDFATSASCTALETAIEAVSGWTATVNENIPTPDLFPTGGIDAKNHTAKFAYPDSDDANYRVDYDIGVIEVVDTEGLRFGDHRRTFTTGTFQGYLVECRAGYETIPADVEFLANEKVKEAYSRRSLNTNIQSENLGDYSYTLASQVQLSENDREILRDYLDLAVGGVR